MESGHSYEGNKLVFTSANSIQAFALPLLKLPLEVIFIGLAPVLEIRQCAEQRLAGPRLITHWGRVILKSSMGLCTMSADSSGKEEISEICGMAGHKKLELRKLLSQAGLCEEALAQTLSGAFAKGTPADKTLAFIFRGRRSIGSRDRNLVSMGVFAVFRWWGWISSLAGEDPSSASKQGCARLLLAACAIEGGEMPDVLDALALDADVPIEKLDAVFKGKNESERAEMVMAILGCPVCKPIERVSVAPPWALTELSKEASLPILYDCLQKRPPIWIRAQTDDVESLCESLRVYGLNPERHPRVGKALKIQGAKVNLHTIKEFNQGLFEVQDISSQCIGLACLPKPGEMWWDVCAGGGGKSLQLADLLKRKGSIRATDTRAYKLEDLKKRAAKAAFHNIHCAPWDGSAPDPKRKAVFDGVLVDAPCSSSGRWRRNPDARWIAKSSWVDELCETQLRILEAASNGVKPGGVLVYATCSMFYREDKGNVERFLKVCPDFALEPFENPLTGVMTDGTMLTLPWDSEGDASFVARFRRISS